VAATHTLVIAAALFGEMLRGKVTRNLSAPASAWDAGQRGTIFAGPRANCRVIDELGTWRPPGVSMIIIADLRHFSSALVRRA